jgi:hypothetical protein
MMAYSKHSYEDQYDGRILKAARKQHYIMFPDPIAFLNDELKAGLGMKSEKWIMKTKNQKLTLSGSINMTQERRKSL